MEVILISSECRNASVALVWLGYIPNAYFPQAPSVTERNRHVNHVRHVKRSSKSVCSQDYDEEV